MAMTDSPMTDYPKTESAAIEVVKAVTDDRIVRKIEQKSEDTSYQETFDTEALEEERSVMGRLLARRITEDDPDVMDSRLGRSLEAIADGIERYLRQFELGYPSEVFTWMEHLHDLRFLVEETASEAIANDWGEPPSRRLQRVDNFLEYQATLTHVWLGHLSRCGECFEGPRPQPILPEIDASAVLDYVSETSAEVSSASVLGEDTGGPGGPFESGPLVGIDDAEEYARLITPRDETVLSTEVVTTDKVGPAILDELGEERLPEGVSFLLRYDSPLDQILADVTQEGFPDAFYIRLVVHPEDVACFVSPEFQMKGEGLQAVSEEVSERLAGHIGEVVRPKLENRSAPTIMLEIETESGTHHILIENPRRAS